MEITTAILSVITALLILSLVMPSYRVRKLAELIDKLPGPKKYPLIGTAKNMLALKREDFFDFFLKQSSEYGPIYRTWIGSVGYIDINKAEYLEKIFSSKYSSKSNMLHNIKPWLKEGLLTINDGPLWNRNRKLVTPAFHLKSLEGFVKVFNEKMVQFISKISTETNQKIDVCPLLANYAIEVICATAMGVEINAMAEATNEYVNKVNRICELVVLRHFKPWYKSDFIYYMSNEGKQFLKYVKFLHGYSGKILAERKKSLIPALNLSEEKVNKKRRLALLDLLLEASKETQITDNEILQEVDTFMGAGYETTSMASAWCLFLLGNHHEVQEKVREEVNNIFRNDTLTIKELNELKYLDCVVKETLRLYPSAPTIGRVLSENIILDEYTIPAGTSLRINIYNIHRDPDHFQDPSKFDPDRFLPENCKGRHPYAYIPFSAGPRNCVGKKFALYEIKTVMAWIIKNYRVRSLEKPENIKIYKEFVLKPQNGIQVLLERL